MFFVNVTATTKIYTYLHTLSLHDALPISNIIPPPAAAGIASLGIDHEAFLLAPEAGTPDDPATRIAWEKAGIIKPETPFATPAYPSHVQCTVAAKVAEVGATLFPEMGREQSRD